MTQNLWDYNNIILRPGPDDLSLTYSNWSDFVYSGDYHSPQNLPLLYWSYVTREQYIERYRPDLERQQYAVDLNDPDTVNDKLTLIWMTDTNGIGLKPYFFIIYVTKDDQDDIRNFIRGALPSFYQTL